MTTSNRMIVLLITLAVLGGALGAAIKHSPADPLTGQPVTFTLIPAYPDIDPAKQLTWNFGDGVEIKRPVGELSINHAYASGGTFTVKAVYYIATLMTLKQVVETVQVKVTAPTKTLAFQPLQPTTCETVVFQAGGFMSPTLRWDFGDGTVLAGGGATANHAYASAGIFTVKVFDNNGSDASPVTRTITVGSNRSLILLTAQPKSGMPVSFQAAGFISSCLLWDFGDGQPRVKGSAAATHVYLNSGQFQVSAFDDCGAVLCAAGIGVTVEASQGPLAPFMISFASLHFENGTTSTSVAQNTSGLTAFADLKFEGSGLLQVEWQVDGQPYKTASQSLGFARGAAIHSGKIPGLPTTIPGPHSVSLRIIKPEAAIVIPAINYYVSMAPQPAPPFNNAQAPVVEAIVPATIEQGKEYTLNLQGKRLTTDTVVALGGGIAVNKFTMISPLQATLAVFVPPTAKLGDRLAQASNGKGISTGPGKVAVEVMVMPPQEPVPFTCTDLNTLVMEPIELKSPQWHTAGAYSQVYNKQTVVVDELADGNKITAETAPPKMAELTIPVINDHKVLRWQCSPIYDFLEVRFFKAGSNSLVLTKKIAGSATSLPLTGALIAELFAAIASYNSQVVFHALDASDANAPGVPFVYGPEMQFFLKAKSQSDILWQVVGFRALPCIYDSKKNTPQQFGQSVLVACSEQWMFNLPDKPNGLACQGSGMENKSADINIRNESLNARMADPALPKGTILTTDYIGDEFFVFGNFDLSRSPYGATAVSDASPTLPNLFIDWGDGSPAANLDVAPGFIIKNTAQSRHVYKKAANQYIIRIFMLSEDDVQQPAANYLARLGKVLAPKETASSSSAHDNPYHTLLEQQGGYHPQAPETGHESFADVLQRAYMIKCLPVTIQPYGDECVKEPLNLVGIEILGFPNHDMPKFDKNQGYKPGSINLKQGQAENYAKQGIDAVAVTCDTALYAEAELTYFGHGYVELIWRVDGHEVQRETIHKELRSQERPNLTLEQSKDCSGALLSREVFPSAAFPVKGPLENSMLGMHTVAVEARVVTQFSASNLDRSAETSVENLLANAAVFHAGDDSGKGPAAAPAAASAQVDPLLAAMSAAEQSGQSAPQVGFVNPDNESAGNPAVVYLNDAQNIQAAAEAAQSPNRVFSGIKRYQVNEVTNQLGCLVLIPDGSGDYFRLTDMSTSISQDQNDMTYSASGTLHVWCPTGTGSVEEAFIPSIQFSKWSIIEETGMLTDGMLDLSTNVNFSKFPAFIQKAVLTRLQGGVENDKPRPMMATFNFDLPMKGLKQIAAGKNVPASIQQAPGQLSTHGDWFAAGLTLGKSQFGYTPFSIQSDQVTIDLSAQKNPPKITKANSWMGVHIGEAFITPYAMGFDLGNDFKMSTTEEWVIQNGGLNGKAKSNKFATTVQLGSFGFEYVEFSMANGTPTGIFHDIKIAVPWLDTTLTGDAELQLHSNGTEYIAKLALDDHAPVSLSYAHLAKQGKVIMTASDFSFIPSLVGSGLPAVECDVRFDLSCEEALFATFTSPKFKFRFDGRGLLDGSSSSQTFSYPNSASQFGPFTSYLTKATLTAFDDNSSNRLDIGIETMIDYAGPGMSAYIPATFATVGYKVFKSGAGYDLEGPISNSNEIDLKFPSISADFNGKLKPQYTPGEAPSSPGGGAASSGPAAGDGSSSVSLSGTRFSAKVPMNIFGTNVKLPIDATFILGSQGGKSYFLTVVDVDLPMPGVALAPIPFSIYGFKGGFGYRFDADTLASADVNAQPNMNVDAAFSAGITLGTTYDKGFTLKGSATLSGDSSGTLQMDFSDCQIFEMGNFGGQLKYSGAVFSGNIFGELKLFPILGTHAAQFSLGGKANPAVHFSFGKGDWHVYAGDKNGQRITASIIGVKGSGYFMFDSNALQAGGGITCVIPPGADTWPLSVYVKSSLEVGFGIFYKPFRLAGDFALEVGVGGCIPVVDCAEFTVGAKAHVEAPDPTYLQVCFSIDWPIVGEKDYCKSLKI